MNREGYGISWKLLFYLLAEQHIEHFYLKRIVFSFEMLVHCSPEK